MPNESEPQSTDLELLAAAVDRDLGKDDSRWFHPRGYDSVAIAILDSIYSTGNRYSRVTNALNRYRKARSSDGADPTNDTASDLISAVARWGGITGLVEKTNRWKTSTQQGAPTKAEAALNAAEILAAHNLETVADVQKALTSKDQQEVSPVKKQWLDITGQRSGLTWTYFLMLCQIPGVKADRMIVRYVKSALDREIAAKEASSLVGALAQTRGISEIRLDHTIWRKESGREIFRDAL